MNKLTCALIALATATIGYPEDVSAQRFGRNTGSFNKRDAYRSGGVRSQRNDNIWDRNYREYDRGQSARGPKWSHGLFIRNSRSFGRTIGGPISRRTITRDAHYHVKYHMHGTRAKNFDSHRLAHRYARFLEALGMHAKVTHGRGCYDVVYHIHGKRSKTFGSHAAAHTFANRLERLGLHAKVAHH